MPAPDKQWKIKIEGESITVSFVEPNGNPIDIVLTFILDLDDPISVNPFSVQIQEIEYNPAGHSTILQSVILSLTPKEFAQMTNRLTQLDTIHQMAAQVMESE